ncbi:MaoC/PaaZ C-terminal domain-containing protein [Nocardia sp. NPDC059177]|uniref:MaoC/PaaZ C-terminal domain-containing protein n=1 Tax=Nocardia sp. NPDC059177 TaxID=3346759 RepID=UPI00367B3434
MTTSDPAAVVFDGAALGQWTDEERFSVTAERIAEYAAATNDPIEAHRSGQIAPPVFAVVPVFTSMAPAALSVAPVELLMKLVHGEQDFRFHRPIVAGDELVVRAKPIGYVGRPNGSTVVIYAETRDAAGELVNEQWMTAFFRKVDAGPGEGEQAPGHRLTEADRASDPAAAVTAHIDEDQTFRYSPASGDPMPIHLDDEIARMAGLPGIINHGLCTMAFTSWAALTELAGADTARLRRLAVRFAKPVLPGQDITTTFWGLDDGAYAFETEAAGEIAITDGRVEFNGVEFN